MSSSIPLKIPYKLIYTDKLLCVKGEYSVGSYDDNLIILKCGKDNLCINGEKIIIDSMDANEIYISGVFSAISFA